MSASVFVSGCYIVKDEEENLPASLEALAPFVDEVVVYDTGSTDRTVEVARAHGARVVEGYWDDDFGAARNRALEHCRGTWVLAVDADELLTGNPALLRAPLRHTRADVFVLEVVSEAWEGGGERSRAVVGRLFRRATCRWRGALHEQLVGRGREVVVHPLPGVVIDHHGYRTLVVSGRGKLERNHRIAEAELALGRERGDERLPLLLINVGRTANVREDHARAVEAFGELDLAALGPEAGVLAAHPAIDSHLRRGDAEGAQVWARALRGWGEGEQVCRLFEARIAMAREDFLAAEALLRSIRPGTDHRGLEVDDALARDYLGECLLRQGRAEEAAAVVLENVVGGRSSMNHVFVVGILGGVPGALDELAARLPDVLVRPFIGKLQREPAAVSAGFFEALWRAGRQRTFLALAASRQWATLPVEQAVAWSLRLRTAGLAEHCPLRAALADPDLSAAHRVLCGAVLVEAGEQDVLAVLEELLPRVEDADEEPLLERLRTLAPGFTASLQLV
ncbi:tetratricopeptide repeat-containing glycosyltransferase family 2 protein [Kineococcus sp. SYSU DK001]|uniref:tetratricopeptide repeat-containing glycosyltransferase family 2 protein n=1 Tax=Kineococcus sp. SYSU DK001 TaxID=3383122 RepID=UPI003D7E44ED